MYNAGMQKVREYILKASEYKTTGVCLTLDIRKQTNMGDYSGSTTPLAWSRFRGSQFTVGLPAYTGALARDGTDEKSGCLPAVLYTAGGSFPRKVESRKFKTGVSHVVATPLTVDSHFPRLKAWQAWDLSRVSRE